MDNEIEKVNTAIFSLMRNALWGEKLKLDMETDWKKVSYELRAQTVLGIAASAELPENFPAEIKEKWELQMLLGANVFYKILQEQENLLHILEKHDIPVVILKGMAAAVYYPHPEIRSMGDIDFLVPIERVEETCRLLLQNGYQMKDDTQNVHICLRKNKIEFELHRYFGRFDSIEKQEKMQSLLEDGMKNAVTCSCAGGKVIMLPTIQNGLVLLNHVMKHMYGGIGLRHIIDWMMYVNCHLTDKEWNGGAGEIIRQLGMSRYAKIITRTCQIYLGLSEEHITWCKDIDKEICRQFIDYVMQRGNFAKKENGAVSARTVSAFVECDSAGAWIKRLRKSGETHWKAVQRYPFLRSVAWVYGFGRYFHLGILRKNSIPEILRERKKAKERSLFLKQLHLKDQNVLVELENNQFVEKRN